MSTINKIRVGSTEYNISASAIEDLASLSINATGNTQTPEILISSQSTGEKEVGNDADIKFEVASNKGVATNGKVAGVVSLNTKGNLSVESLNKHVNIEAAKAIQLKPTTNIIFDTSRRASKDGGDNEAVVETKYDDLTVADGEEYKQFGSLKFHARAVDIRCLWHGGIALQVAGIDGSGHENKIKFESSRKVGANSTIPGDLRKESSNYGDYYNIEGGKGVEFATFNNEHTSIFSKDYRFNKDGKVFSVVRGTPVVDGDKTDYPTQADDFKDIPVDNKGTNASYNTTTGEWGLASGTKGSYLISATWNSIVKTANALNETSWVDTNISGNNNLQITTSDEIEWVEIPDYNGEFIELEQEAPKRKYVDDGNVYKLPDSKFYTCQLITDGEHHLNLEAESTVKIESAYDDVELNAGDKVQVKAPIIQLEATNTLDLSTTENIVSLAGKVTKSGALESNESKLYISSINNFRKTVYKNQSGDVRIPFDVLYDGEGLPIDPEEIIETTKTTVYTSSSHTTVVPDGIYIILGSERLALLYEVEGGQIGKKAKVCQGKYNPSFLFTDSSATIDFVLNTTPGYDYSDDRPSLYTDVDTPAAYGFHIVSTNDGDYIIKVSDDGKLTKFNINNNGGSNGKQAVVGWCLALEDRLTSEDYSRAEFGGPDSADDNETAINPGSTIFEPIECSLMDIIILVNHFKNSESSGYEYGPWANGSGSSGYIKN